MNIVGADVSPLLEFGHSLLDSARASVLARASVWNSGPVEAIRVQGRALTGDDRKELRAWIVQHPDWHRTALSVHRLVGPTTL